MNYKLRKRLSVISLNTVYNLSTSVFSAVISLLVIRLCSPQLWGAAVEILLWIGIAAHLLYWGNRDFLLREFSLEPMNLHFHWQRNMHARIWLFFAAFLIPLVLPIDFKLKLMLPLFLGARFLYQSYDVIILFKKRFLTSIVFETIAFVIIITFIWFYYPVLSINGLVAIFTTTEFVKAAGMYIVFHKEFPLKSLRFHKEYFSKALPFFLLGFTGLFQSRVDLICVTFYLPRPQVAQYQVYINFLLVVQAASNFILAPFVKNIYRLKHDSIMRIAIRLFLIGIICTAIAIPSINYILQTLYHFRLPMLTLISGGLFVIPVYYYSPIIYYILKLNGQRALLTINIAGIIVALILNVIFIPNSSNGISGAIDAIAITQWLLLIGCLVTGRINSRKNVINQL